MVIDTIVTKRTSNRRTGRNFGVAFILVASESRGAGEAIAYHNGWNRKTFSVEAIESHRTTDCGAADLNSRNLWHTDVVTAGLTRSASIMFAAAWLIVNSDHSWRIALTSLTLKCEVNPRIIYCICTEIRLINQREYVRAVRKNRVRT